MPSRNTASRQAQPAPAALTQALAAATERWPVHQRYLIGVSGGVDSVVLLHSLRAAGYQKLVICHLDHSLRGHTSTADARWVARLAESLKLPCHLTKTNLRAAAAAAGQSLETSGRHARHRAFAEAARRYRCPRIFLAHHADDQAETVLMNLCRGSAGATGMAAETAIAVPGFRQTLTLLRPLLTIPKTTLITAASTAKWGYRQDASNAIADVIRNRLRLEVLPLLDEIFQRPVAPALARAATWTAAARDWLLEAAAPFSSQEKLRPADLLPLPYPPRNHPHPMAPRPRRP